MPSSRQSASMLSRAPPTFNPRPRNSPHQINSTSTGASSVPHPRISYQLHHRYALLRHQPISTFSLLPEKMTTPHDLARHARKPARLAQQTLVMWALAISGPFA